MNNRNFISLTLVLILAISAGAQQDPLFPVQSSNSLNSMFPEFNGWHGGLQVSAYKQHEFTGYTGSPRTHHINLDAYLAKIHSAIAINVIDNRDRQLDKRELNFTATPRIVVGDDLSLLPTFGYTRTQLLIGATTFDWFPSPNYFKASSNQMQFGLGIVWRSWYSAIHYQGASTFDYPDPSFATNPNLNTSLFVHPVYSFVAGSSFSRKGWVFSPNIIARSDLSSMWVSLNLNAEYRKIIVGVAYDAFAAVKLGVGYDLFDRYQISYANRLYTSRLIVAGPTHELAIRILLFDRAKHRLISNVGIF